MARFRDLARGGVVGGFECHAPPPVGVLVFLASNVLWSVWGWHTQAWALIALQLCLAALDVRGLRKTETTESA